MKKKSLIVLTTFFLLLFAGGLVIFGGSVQQLSKIKTQNPLPSGESPKVLPEEQKQISTPSSVESEKEIQRPLLQVLSTSSPVVHTILGSLPSQDTISYATSTSPQGVVEVYTPSTPATSSIPLYNTMGTTSATSSLGGMLPLGQESQPQKPSLEKITSSMDDWGKATSKQTETLKKSLRMYQCTTISCFDAVQSESYGGEQNSFVAEAFVIHNTLVKTFLSTDPLNPDALKTFKSIISRYDGVMPAAYKTRTTSPVNYEQSVIIASLSYGFLYSRLEKDAYTKITDGIHPQQYILEAIKVNSAAENSSGLKTLLDEMFLYFR